MAEVTIEALDADGSAIGSHDFQLQPGEVRIGLIQQLIQATLGTTGGHVKIRSTAPVLAAEIFGSDSQSFMAAVPGN